MRLVALVALVATLGGCGRSSEVCTGSVADYCAQSRGPCPSFEAAVAQRRSLCSQPGAWAVTERHCVGRFRSVSWREALLGGGEEFFGTNGQLLAAVLTTDYQAYCGGQSFSQVFGSVPTCSGELISTPLCGR